MKYFVEIEDQVLEVEVDGHTVRVDGEPVEADLLGRAGDDTRLLRLGHTARSVVVGPARGDRRVLHLDGRPVPMSVVDERTRRVREMSGAAGAAGGPRPLTASMPGLVVKVDVEVGQAVVEGQGLVIVEAMKMENELRAEAAGVISRVLVKPGQAVEKDEVLVDFAAPEDEEARAEAAGEAEA